MILFSFSAYYFLWVDDITIRRKHDIPLKYTEVLKNCVHLYVSYLCSVWKGTSFPFSNNIFLLRFQLFIMLHQCFRKMHHPPIELLSAFYEICLSHLVSTMCSCDVFIKKRQQGSIQLIPLNQIQQLLKKTEQQNPNSETTLRKYTNHTYKNTYSCLDILWSKNLG